MLWNLRDLNIALVSTDVQIKAFSLCLLHKSLLNLQHNLLLQNLLLPVFDLRKLWFLWWPPSLIPLVDHLDP